MGWGGVNIPLTSGCVVRAAIDSTSHVDFCWVTLVIDDVYGMSIPSIAWLGSMLISADVKTVGAFFLFWITNFRN
jgi:hypothetical protein